MAATPAQKGYNEAGDTDSSRRTKQLVGWPTCTENDAKASAYTYSRGQHETPALKLTGAARLTNWRTPDANIRGGDYLDPEKVLTRMREGHQVNLSDQSTLATWASPTLADARRGPFQTAALRTKEGRGAQLPDQAAGAQRVRMSGWASPAARDFKSDSATEAFRRIQWAHPRGKPLSAQVTGISATGSTAATTSGGPLNPAHSRWLMGYPPAWDVCGVTAMPSSRRSRPSSSTATVRRAVTRVS